MSQYAKDTTVSAARSREEIEATLTRYGASAFMYGWNEKAAVIQFQLGGRMVKFELKMPDKQDPQFWTTPTGRARKDTSGAEKLWEQATRQRWRALALVIRAKLEAVESGITTAEQEFLAHTLLPNGETVSSFMLPQLAEVYASGKMPQMLLLGHREGA